MPVTILDIARAAGKSYPTVSRALNDHPKISAKTKAEIRAVAARLGYRPSFAGTALKKGKTATFSVLVPDLADPFYADFIHYFRKSAGENGFDTVVYDYERDSGQERRCLERMLTGCCDGTAAFLTSFRHTHDLVEALWNARIPLTAIGTPHMFAGNTHYDWCSVDTSSSLLKILRKLKQQGKKHFVRLLPSYPEEINALLAAELREILHRSGFASSDSSIHPLHTQSSDQAEEGLAATLDLLEHHPETDVIHAMNGFQAYGVLLAAHRKGRTVPDDLAVIVNDDTWIGRCSVTPLFRIDQCPALLAAGTVKNLCERNNAERWEAPRRFLVESRAILPATARPKKMAPPLPRRQKIQKKGESIS